MNEPTVPMDQLLKKASWLQSLAQELVGDPHRAPDFVQETWVHALAHPPRAGTPVRAWLRTVMGRRRARDGDARGAGRTASTALRTTDHNGRIVIAHLPAASYYVYSDLGNGEIIRVHGSLRRGESREVSLGSKSGKIEVTGRILTQLGETVTGPGCAAFGQIEFSRRGPSGHEVHPTTIASDGSFRLQLAAGTYNIHVRLPKADGAASFEGRYGRRTRPCRSGAARRSRRGLCTPRRRGPSP